MPAYNIDTELFQGPFDLLLHLVSKQKVDIHALSLTEITQDYIETIEHMKDLDLDVASEFLYLASTLLEIKAASLLPKDEIYVGDEMDDLSPHQMRDLLARRLIAYKQIKNAAGMLSQRQEVQGHQFARNAGLEDAFVGLMPDYLEGVTLRTLGLICADLAARREVFLLEADHVASMPISLESYATRVRERLPIGQKRTFSQLLDTDATSEEVVVTFLAILELYKRGKVQVTQPNKSELIICALSDEEALKRGYIQEDYDEY